ncbi:MAG: Integrase/recombinase [Microgenomates group bacterium GW2011_GWA2_46_7]|nr:MAG: Integrase/recombinase [Microgenomates group bacterium GW2011_GWA2_46_7]
MQAQKDQFIKYLQKNGRASATILAYAKDLDQLLVFLEGIGIKFLISEGLIPTSPATSVSHPKYDIAPPRILSPLEYRALRDSVRDDVRMYGIVELLLQTGLRIGELAGLQLQDIALEKSYLKIRAFESHEARKVPLNATAKSAIEKYVKERPKTKNTTLFITKTGNPFLIRNIRTAVVGHKRLSTTEKYLAFLNGAKSEPKKLKIAEL